MMKDNINWEQAVLWLRDQPNQQELVRACYYDDPLLEAAKRFETSEEWKTVREILPYKPGKALDLGAGRGISSYALAKAGWNVTALEPDPSPIVGREAISALAEETNLPINPMDGYAEKIPCVDAYFDLVYGRQVMHHAQNLQAMCNEIVRVLKPGGVFIATREHVISKKADLPLFLKNHSLHHLYGGENAYLLNEYLDALNYAGLKIIQVFGPMATAINYFPLTKNQWLHSIQAPLVRRLGYRTTRFMLSDNFPWSNFINYYLANWSDKRSQAPGRLYSFITMKKKSL